MFDDNEILIYKSIVSEIQSEWYSVNLRKEFKILNDKFHPWLLKNLSKNKVEEEIEHLNNLNMGIKLEHKNSFILVYIKTRNERLYLIDEFLINM